MYIWMKVTDDEYEFPVQMADTQRELAELCGVRRASIASAIGKSRKRKHRCCYVRVEIDDELWWTEEKTE